MINYQDTTELFVDGIDFTKNDPCIWVVYPPGAAGDCLAALINFHYVQTGCRYFGVTDCGQTIFRPSDNKLVNRLMTEGKLEFTENFFYQFADSLSEKHLNYSLLDQVIFSNHAWQSNNLNKILCTFSNAKIIRLLPNTIFEERVIFWLASFKNFNIIQSLPEVDHTALLHQNLVKDSRIVDIYFGELLSLDHFELVYQRIINHLNLSGPLIRFDFVNYWINCQSNFIKPSLNIIKSHYDTN